MNSDKKYYFGNSAFSISCALLIGVCGYLARRLTSGGLPGNEYAFFYSTFALVSMMVAFVSLGIPNAAFFCIPDARNRGRDDEARGFMHGASAGVLRSVCFWRSSDCPSSCWREKA